jgi:transposase
MEPIHFEQLISMGCRIDVHKDIIVATIRKNNKVYQIKSFNAFTSSLIDLRDWCKSEAVNHILEEDFETILVNALHIKNVVPRHKTDKKDSIFE